jgi:integrase
MASLSREQGSWRLQVMLPDRTRKTLRLGAIARRDAEKFKEHVERIVACIRFANPIDPETAVWAAKLPDETFSKLVDIGLMAPRQKAEAATLAGFVEGYIEGRKGDAAPASIELFQKAKENLIEFFGADRLLSAIAPGETDDFRIWLRKRVGENTTARRVAFAKQFFRAAVRRRLLVENPFADLTGGVKPNASRFYFVDRDAALRVLDACPSAEWRMIFALARFGGLRIPSELVGLKWTDVDWARNRLRVESPKTRCHGKAERIIPLFPELAKPLQELFDLAPEGETFVVPLARDPSINLRTGMVKIIRAAGLVPWAKTFQNLRSSRQT